MAKIGELIRTNKLPSLEGSNQSNNIENNVEETEESGDNESKKSVNFADTVEDFINTVNKDKKEAADIAEKIVQGESDNISEAMAKMEKADLSFDLMLKIRNKLINSYDEIKRMQI